MIKSTIRCVYDFSRILLNFNFPASTFILFSFSSTYHPTSFIISEHQQFLVTSSIIFHFYLCPATSILQCNWIISVLNILSFNTYTFFSFNTKSSSICYSSPLNIFTSAFFISSTTLTTSLSLLVAFLIFFTISTSGPSITTLCKLYSQQFLINIWSSMSFYTPTFQSGLLLSPSTFPIFVPETCFKMKLDLNKYYTQQACLWFNFCIFIKYSKFLQSIQTSNLYLVPSNKCFQFSNPLITANISLS